MIRIFCALFVLTTFANFVVSQETIRHIYLEREEVFERGDDDWFFAAPLFNSVHTLTREYVIRDELLFEPGDEVDEDILYETERNLRDLDVFTKARIELDYLDDGSVDVYVVTKDKWSLMPELLVGSGGNEHALGLSVQEENLIGTATELEVEGVRRSENDIGMQGYAQLKMPRAFRTEYKLEAEIFAHRFRTEQNLLLSNPFRSIADEYSYGAAIRNFYGYEFLYKKDEDYELMPFHEKRLGGWFSRSWLREDRVFASVYVEYEDVDRGEPRFRQALDNSGKILLGFSSVSENYVRTKKLNNFLDEDLPIGGWGTAIIGKTFPIGSRGERVYYVGGQGERSVLYDDKLYLFGQITGGSGFEFSRPKYTYQEFMGLGFYRFAEDLLLAARIREQKVWNWEALRQLVLDNDAGLRGYDANKFTGENRVVSNLELRYFNDYKFFLVRLSGAVFWDCGTVWDIDTKLDETRWHNSVGFGIRFHSAKSSSESGIFRIDFAYNFDEGKFGGIIIETNQLFSVYKRHAYSIPQIFGREFDYE